MIYLAGELALKLEHLTLCGVNEEGVLEWIGDDRQWKLSEAVERMKQDKEDQDFSNGNGNYGE